VSKYIEWPKKLTQSIASQPTREQWDRAIAAVRPAVNGSIVSVRHIRQLLRLSKAPFSRHVAIEAVKAASGDKLIDLAAYPESVWDQHLALWCDKIRSARAEDGWKPR
jgi:hypothetical protein